MRGLGTYGRMAIEQFNRAEVENKRRQGEANRNLVKDKLGMQVMLDLPQEQIDQIASLVTEAGMHPSNAYTRVTGKVAA